MRALELEDLANARRWLERTRRLVPDDAAVAMALGSVLLRLGAPRAALALLHPLAMPEAWTLRAAAHLAEGDGPAAAAMVALVLQSRVPTAELATLADRAAPAGWIGLDRAGRVHHGPVRPRTLRLDGVPVGCELPPGWEAAGWLEAEGAVGSPLPVQRIVALTGFVEREGDRLTGWACHLADPDADPTIVINDTRAVVVSEPADGVIGLPPLARPRRFRCALPAADPIVVTDRHGHPLLGSPLPRAVDDPVEAPTAQRPPVGARAVTIVIPVHGGGPTVLSCLETVLAHSDAADIHIVEDGPSDLPLTEWAAAGRVRVTRHAAARGYPAAANTGLRAAAGRDVVLLNSDVSVPPGWLGRLRRAAYAAPDIATATPLSNEGSIVSYPKREGGNAVPDGPDIDAAAQAANAGAVSEIPVGVGFCLYLRRDALDHVGPLRADLFAQGYGEETEFCLRARRAGWRHVAALDLFVGHHGGHSFPLGAADLRRRNDATVARLYPEFPALVADHHDADPLLPARRRIETRLRRAPGASVLLITHDRGGGTEEFVTARAASIRAAGLTPLVLRPAARSPATRACVLDDAPNLRFRVPEELPALADLLGRGVTRIEVHHLLGHDRSILSLAALLDAPVETWVHDASPFCPRLSLIGAGRRYCGEPDLAGCERCIASEGHFWHEDVTVAALRAMWAALFARSRRVVVPAVDGARRLARHFRALAPEVEPLEDDTAWSAPRSRSPGSRVRVVVPGAIGVEKGYDVLRACVADANARSLPLDFVVCGHTEDDEALMAAGPAFVTGPYAPEAAVALLREQAADIAFLPSIWPESWCLALSRAWQAGLFAVAFDLGAPAERILATGRGALLPLALAPAAVNDSLLRLARLRASGQTPQPERESDV